MVATEPNETPEVNKTEVNVELGDISALKDCKECYSKFQELGELEKLEEMILISNNSDFVKFVSEKYEYQGIQSTKILYKKVEDLAKLEKKTVELGIARIESMIDLYDPTKSVSVIAAILVALLATYSVFINSYFSSVKWLASGSFVFNVVLYGMTFVYVSKKVGEARVRKYRLQYFKGLLQLVLKQYKN